MRLEVLSVGGRPRDHHVEVFDLVAELAGLIVQAIVLEAEVDELIGELLALLAQPEQVHLRRREQSLQRAPRLSRRGRACNPAARARPC